jgi:hypothetical protein
VANQDDPYYNRAMTETPEERAHHREEILAHSALIRTFLDPDAGLDPSGWRVRLNGEYQAAEDEIQSIHGDNFLKYTAPCAYIAAESHGIFAPHINSTQRLVFSRIMLTLGYEIEDPSDAIIVAEDTFLKFNDMGVWNVGDEEDQENLSGVMNTYVNILALGLLLRSPDADMPTEFLEFFKNRT